MDGFMCDWSKWSFGLGFRLVATDTGGLGLTVSTSYVASGLFSFHFFFSFIK